jgi:hypothetical protein
VQYNPSSASAYGITMEDNSGHPISYPLQVGPLAFVMFDEGTAF